MKIDDIVLQVFEAQITKTKPITNITLQKLLKTIQNPPSKLRSIFNHIKSADKKEKALLKQKLYYFTPSVIVKPDGKRRYKDIVEFTGLLTLDFDKVPKPELLKNHLFEQYQFIIAAWLSTSGTGVRCLVKIPVIKIMNNNIQQAIDEFKGYFWGLANEYFMKYEGFDIATQNCVLPMFLSMDENILIRNDFVEWYIKSTNPKQIKQNTKPFRFRYSITNKNKKLVISNIKKAIDKIYDNGHPQLRAASFSLGGYVGAGYIDEYEAIELIDQLIESNSYLNIKPNTYKRTARTMIREGQYKPLYI